jgi:hypothetical protein
MPLEYGQIVLAPVPDGRGHIKIRPVVILTSIDEIRPGEALQVACITTHVETPIQPDHIPLPWHRGRHPRTGLDKPNVVKCNWLAQIDPADIIRVMGIIPGPQMIMIAAALRRLAETDDDRPAERGDRSRSVAPMGAGTLGVGPSARGHTRVEGPARRRTRPTGPGNSGARGWPRRRSPRRFG